MDVYTYNPNSREAEAETVRVQGQILYHMR